MPDVPVECQLFTKYKSDLWRHRLKNTEPMAATHDQPEAPIKQDHGPVAMVMEPDGSLTLGPRFGVVPTKKEETPPLGTEQSDDDEDSMAQADDAAAGKAGKPVADASLDPWAIKKNTVHVCVTNQDKQKSKQKSCSCSGKERSKRCWTCKEGSDGQGAGA